MMMLENMILSMGWILEYIAVSYWAIVLTPLIAYLVVKHQCLKTWGGPSEWAKEYFEDDWASFKELIFAMADKVKISDALKGPATVIRAYRMSHNAAMEGWHEFVQGKFDAA